MIYKVKPVYNRKFIYCFIHRNNLFTDNRETYKKFTFCNITKFLQGGYTKNVFAQIQLFFAILANPIFIFGRICVFSQHFWEKIVFTFQRGLFPLYPTRGRRCH